MSANTDSRQVDLGPGIPRVDITPLDLPPTEPATKPERCWLCNGHGDQGDGPDPCPACNGAGTIGGGR